ncbi:YqaI family protein [Peribacillus muralis]|uniref:YqaI family protein n=1 Tax=Peribacillus muralis TaxID=264697 RepID=UPI00381E3670
MANLKHPKVTEILKTGYANLNAQPEYFGTDYFGNEVLKGDSVVIDPSNGEMVLEVNLEDYLIEVKGFQFKTAD